VQLVAVCAISLIAIAIGWLSPVRGESAAPSAISALIRTAVTAVLVVTVLLGPGIAIRACRPRMLPSITFLAFPGLALLVLAGLTSWALARTINPQLISDLWLGPVVAGVGMCAVVRGGALDRALSPGERRAIVVYALVLCVAVAKGLWSVGPAGELYAGTVSRTLEVGDRSDSRISFVVVQLVAHGAHPYSGAVAANFLPFNFASRGPLSGLAAAPITLSSGPNVPVGAPDQPWQPFDPQGFAAYRIAMEAMALTALLAVYGLTCAVTRREAAAVFAVAIAAVTPFVVHEAYFTWPKLLTAALVLSAAELVLARRVVRSGLTAGMAYLMHPSALLSVPTLVAVCSIVSSGARSSHRALGVAVRCGGVLAGLALIYAVWRGINGAHLSGQFNEFGRYLFQVNAQPVASLSEWLQGRLNSIVNTLVPFWLFVFNSANNEVNVFGGHSPRIIHFFFQYWNTLPFGVGIVFYPFLGLVLARFTRRHPWISGATVILPFVVFAVYWGATTTGMLREGLHVWVLTLLIIFVWEVSTSPPNWLRSRFFRLVLLSRAGETLLMLVLPSAETQRRLVQSAFVATDVLALLAIAVTLAVLAYILWRELDGRTISRSFPEVKFSAL
jgi:hypothetical protein